MPKPPPVIDEANDEYEIEYIRDHRDAARGWQYLVHWLGYPDTDDEWIHEGNIDAWELIEEYLSELEENEQW